MKKSSLINMGAALAMGIASFAATATPAAARDHYRGYDRGDYYGGGNRGYRGYDGYRGDRGYRDYDGYRGGNYYRGGGNYRGSSYRCRDDGTGGTIIGAIAGGLLGHEVVGRRGDNTTGTILGAGVGALAGRAIDRGDGRC
jgi:hypothetical protein